MSNLVRGLAFGTPKFYNAPYGKINQRLLNLSYTCEVKSGLRPDFTSHLELRLVSPRFILPYGKINQRLLNLSYTCEVKSGLRATFCSDWLVGWLFWA